MGVCCTVHIVIQNNAVILLNSIIYKYLAVDVNKLLLYRTNVLHKCDITLQLPNADFQLDTAASTVKC